MRIDQERGAEMEATQTTQRDESHVAIPHGCYNGWQYVGHLVVDEDGEEVEVIEQTRCRRCALTEYHERF
jgi:hypothetical protein